MRSKRRSGNRWNLGFEPRHGRLMRIEMLEDRHLLTISVTNYRYDDSSSGVDSNETTLTPANVVPGTFDKQFSTTLDGQVYAQPLLVSGLTLTQPGTVNAQNVVYTAPDAAGAHDVVFAATENDSLYAIDAHSGEILWKDSFTISSSTVVVTTIPPADTDDTLDITNEIGITSTPAIDPTTGYLYLVAQTKEVHNGDTADPHYVVTLYKVNIANGDATSTVVGDTTLNSDGSFTYNSGPYVPGTGDGAIVVDGQSRVYFNALRQLFRPAVTLNEGQVLISTASHGDVDPYHGWLLAYDENTLAASGVLNTEPNGGEGGIWQGGNEIDVDAQGYMYFETGNGDFNTSSNNFNAAGFPIDGDYGNSFLKVAFDPTTSPSNMNVNGWGLKVVDYFTPSNEAQLNLGDIDLGSGGPLLLPASAGSAQHPNLLVGGGKAGTIYVIDCDNMGKFDAAGDQIVQEVPSAIGGIMSVPTYYNGQLYYNSAFKGDLMGFAFSDGMFTLNASGAVVPDMQTPDSFGREDGGPIVSSNGQSDGVLWAISVFSSQLRAYDPSNLSDEIYNSTNLQDTSDAPSYATMKFSEPLVANGDVYIGTMDSIEMYGLNPPPPPPPPNVVNFENLTVSSTPVPEPLVLDGYDFTSAGNGAGSGLLVEGKAVTVWPGGWPSNVLMAANWGTTINITSASGGTFSINSLDVDVYEQAESAVITGYSATGAVLDQQDENFSVSTGQYATTTAILNWTGVSRVNISWWQNTNGTGGTRFGAIDNVNFNQTTATTTSLTASANPATVGQKVTFIAQVTVPSPGTGTPTGTVTFFDGSNSLGTGTLTSVNGVVQASLTTSSLALGGHTITAQYSGDATFSGSSALLAETIQAVNAGLLTPTLTVSQKSETYADEIFTPHCSVAGSGSQSTAGTSLEGVTPSLTYYAGISTTGTPLGGAPAVVGTYTVLASFAGSTDYTSAVASATYTISPAQPTLNVTDSSGIVGSSFAATDSVGGVGGQSAPAGSLEGVRPTLTYYSGASTSGTVLGAPPTAVGTYTAAASFAGSTDYTAALASTTFTISPAGSGALLAYDGFTGAAGPLEGDTGGSGWNTSTTAGTVGWYVQNLSTTVPGYQVNAAGLTYGTLQTSGGSASGGTSYLTAGRRLDTTTAFAPYDVPGTKQIGASGTTLWFSVLVDRQTAVGGGQTATSIDFSNNSVEWLDSSPEFGVGYYGSASDSAGAGYWSLLVGGTVVKSTTPVTVGTTALLVLGMTFTSTGDTFSLYVNPTSLGGSAPTAASAQLTGSNLTFSSLVYNAGGTANTSTIDELRLGTTFAAVTPATTGGGKTAPTLTLIDASGTYTAAPFTAATAVIEGVTPTVTYYSGTSTTGAALSGAPSAAGTYTVLESFSGSTDYTSGTTSLTFSITQAAPSVKVTDAGGTASGGTFAATDSVAGVGNQSTPAGSLEGVTPTLTYYSGTTATGTALGGAPSAAGTYTVLASFAGSADYNSAAASATFIISQAGGGTLLAYDGFTGAAGPLEGDTDGSGWNTSTAAGTVGWYVQNLSTTTPGYQVNAAGLSYPGLQTSGGSAAGGSQYLTAGRRLDTTTAFASYDVPGTKQIGAAGTTLWFSVLVDRQTAVGGGQSSTSIDFNNNAVEWLDSAAQFGVGYYGAASDSGGAGYWSLMVGGNVVKSSTPITVGTPTLLVLTMSFTAAGDSFSLYVNPASLGGSAPAAASATSTGASITFSSLVDNAGASSGVSTIDELRLGTTFAAVTPPATGGGKTAPTLTLIDASGTYNTALFTATTAVIEGVTPTVTYYSGTSTTGAALSGAPSTVGAYTALESFSGSTDYTTGTTSLTFSITKATPSVSVTDAGGTASGGTFPATDAVAGVGSQSAAAGSLEGVTPTLTYYSGTTASGTPLGGAPSAVGTYAVLASFAGSTDYTSVTASTTFVISQAGGGTLLAYDGFTGAAGPLEGDTDGSGWNTSTSAGTVGWYVQNLNTATPGYQVNSTGLNYWILQTSGGSASGGSAYLTAGRRLDTTTTFAPYDVPGTKQIGAAGTTLWFSALVDRQTAVGGGQAATSIDFNNNSVEWFDNSPEFGVGYYGAASDSAGAGYWSLMVGGTVVKSNTPIVVGQTALLVLQMSFSSAGDTFNLYVDPASLGGSAPPAAAAQGTGTNISFSSLIYNAGNVAGVSTIDELRIGTSFAAVTPTAGSAPQAAVAAASVATPFQNPVNPLDVLGTGGAVVPADALAVISYLNTHPGGALPPTTTGLTQYLDVLGTGTVTPLDALVIIDYLNAHPLSAGMTPATLSAVDSPPALPAAAGGAVDLPSSSPTASPAVSPAVTAVSQLSSQSASGSPGGAAGTAAVTSVQMPAAAISPAGTRQVPINPPATPTTASTNSRRQLQALDALLSDPGQDWLDG